MLVFGGYALDLNRAREIDAWGTFTELKMLQAKLPRSFLTQQKFPERWTLSRSRRDGRVFLDYEVVSGRLAEAISQLPDNTPGSIYGANAVEVASDLTCCLIKQAAIETVPDVNPKHAVDLGHLWPVGLLDAIEQSQPHRELFDAFREHLRARYNPVPIHQ